MNPQQNIVNDKIGIRRVLQLIGNNVVNAKNRRVEADINIVTEHGERWLPGDKFPTKYISHRKTTIVIEETL